MVDQILDISGLKCPLPILKTKKTLKHMADGEILEILATDLGFSTDIAAFCEQTGNKLLEIEEQNGIYRCCVQNKI